MDIETLKNQLIESEIQRACAASGADVEKVGAILRPMAMVLEDSTGLPVVAVRVCEGSNVPRMSTDIVSANMDLAEFCTVLKPSHPDAFATPVSLPDEQPRSDAVFVRDGNVSYTKHEAGQLKASELMRLGRDGAKAHKAPVAGRRVTAQEAEAMTGPELMNSARSVA